MKRSLLALALSLAACASDPALVPEGPPDARVESRGKKPPGDVFWQDGHWSWRDGDRLWFWEAGGWAQERPGFLWIPGAWRRVEEDGQIKGWTWVEPRWEQQHR